jgi:hypothetical protein
MAFFSSAARWIPAAQRKSSLTPSSNDVSVGSKRLCSVIGNARPIQSICRCGKYNDENGIELFCAGTGRNPRANCDRTKRVRRVPNQNMPNISLGLYQMQNSSILSFRTVATARAIQQHNTGISRQSPRFEKRQTGERMSAGRPAVVPE